MSVLAYFTINIVSMAGLRVLYLQSIFSTSELYSEPTCTYGFVEGMGGKSGKTKTSCQPSGNGDPLEGSASSKEPVVRAHVGGR